MSRIPKDLHYIFGMAPDFGGKPWSLIHHVCLKSALERLKPDRAFLYYEHEPTGPWWALSRPLLTLEKVEAPREIFGNPLLHVAHRCDVLRLQILMERGGIYLDADVLVQRSFDDLLDNAVVMGLEGEGGSYGMANAVILSEPRSPFLDRWYDSYHSFRSTGRDAFWGEHSVEIPHRLAQAHPGEITVLPHTAFFWPLWTQEHVEWIFASTRPIPLDDTYANHLWEAQVWPLIEDLTPGRVRKVDSNFNLWARPFLEGLSDGYGAPSVAKQARKLTRRIVNRARAARGDAKSAVTAVRRRTEAVVFGEATQRRRVFQNIYKHKAWGDGADAPAFFSGVGSRGEAVRVYVEGMAAELRKVADTLDRPIRVVDVGCGDFEVGRALIAAVPNMTYVGCDIVPELIGHHRQHFAGPGVDFQVLDVVEDDPVEGDVCLIRQVLQHLPNRDIAKVIGKLRHPYVYITEGQPEHRTGPINPDKVAGADVRYDWRKGVGRGVELSQAPYGLKTEVLFTAFAPPHEKIVTERVYTTG